MGELLQTRLSELWGPAVLGVLGLCALGIAGWLVGRAPRLAGADPASRKSLLLDLSYACLSPFTEAANRVLTVLCMAGAAWLVGVQVQPELLQGFGPLSRQPRALMLIEMLVLGDLIYYFTHRAVHTVPALWRFHAVHHSTEHLRPTAALRGHPVEAYVVVLNHVPLFLLGFPLDVLLPATPFITLYALFIHSGSDVAFRRLRYVLNSPAFHRWHHARDVEGPGVNFAGLFPIFDALFGTYRLPREAPAAFGVRGDAPPADLLGQLRFPFRARPRVAARASDAPRRLPWLERIPRWTSRHV